MKMTDLERELLALVLVQSIMIRDLKVKIRVINPDGEFYSPEDWHDCSEVVQQAILLIDKKETK